MTKEELVRFVDDYLKKLGYIRKGKSWYKENSETITIFTLDKSQYSLLYYASLHFSLRGINKEKFPKLYKTHAYFRAEYFMDEDPKHYLYLENELDDNLRKQEIKKLLQRAASILKLFETTKGIKKTLKLYNPRVLGIKLNAQNYLRIKIK